MAILPNDTLASDSNIDDPDMEEIELLGDEDLIVALEDDEDNQDFETYLTDEELDNHYRNLVDDLDEEELSQIANIVCENADLAQSSRSDWMSTVTKGLDFMGVEIREGTKPFKGACSAQHPLLMESAVKFQSKASIELLPAGGPVRTQILGDYSTEREEQALRVQKHMNYQIEEEMTEYFPDTEKLLLYTAIVGSSFKKTYYDSRKERPVSEFVPVDNFLVMDDASDLYRAEHYTHVLNKTRNNLNGDFASGLYKKPETMFQRETPAYNEIVTTASEHKGFEVQIEDENSDSASYEIYEQHVEMFIEGLEDDEKRKEFEVASPYVITVEPTSKSVLGIRRLWKPNDDEKRNKVVKFTHFSFVPSFGFHSYGFLHLLGNLQMTLTSSLRSLIDSGQFANLQGGFKLKGVKIADNDSPIKPGEFRNIEAGISDLSKAIYPLPFKEPSMVLYQMLEFLDRKGQQFADSTEQVVADSTNYGPVGTTLALLDASTKFFSAIHKRLHKAQKHELKLIADINGMTLPEDLQYNIQNETLQVSRQDYDNRVDIIPVSDPNQSSAAHRITKAQEIFNLASQSREQHDMREVLKRVYTAMDVGEVDKLLPPPEEAERQEPLEDIQDAVKGTPIKAFPGQDHDAHIAIKQGFLQNPVAGGSPSMEQASMVIQANINEHMYLKFVAEMEAVGGNPAEAAARVAQINLERFQEANEQAGDQQGEAAMLLAQAEMMDKQNDKQRNEFDALYKTGELELKKEELDLEKMKLLQELEETQSKLKNDIDKIVVTKTLDAHIKRMTEQLKKDIVNVDNG